MSSVSNATKYIFPETEGSAFAGLRHYMDKSTCSDYESEGKKGQKRTGEGSREDTPRIIMNLFSWSNWMNSVGCEIKGMNYLTKLN